MFDGLKNLGNVGEMLKQARQMQEQLKSMQEQLSQQRVTADAGAGMVQATVNGKLELVALKIDKSRIDVNDTEMLEEVIIAAVKAAQAKAQETMHGQMEKAMEQLGIPPGLLGGMGG